MSFDKIQIVDCVGTSSNLFDYNNYSNSLIYSLGSNVIYYDLKTNRKTFIEFSQNEKIILLKFVGDLKQFIITIDNNLNLIIYLEENFEKLFNKNIFVINETNFQIEKIFLEKFIEKNKFLLCLSSKQTNIIYYLNIEYNNFNIQFLSNYNNNNNFLLDFKIFFNTFNLIFAFKNNIQYFSVNLENKKLILNFNYNFSNFNIIENSIKIHNNLNLLTLINNFGFILFFDRNGNFKNQISPFNQNEIFIFNEFYNNFLFAATLNKIFVFNVQNSNEIEFVINNNNEFLSIQEKFLLNQTQKITNSKNFQNNIKIPQKIKFFIVDVNFDLIIIKFDDNFLLISSLNKLTKNNFFNNKNNNIFLYNFSHNSNIINIETNEKFIFTNAFEQKILKFQIDNNNLIKNFGFYDMKKINNIIYNDYYSNNKIYISTIKLKNDFLFAGDNKGNLYVFNTNQNDFDFEKFIIGNFGIFDINFFNEKIIITFETGMNVIFNKKYEFLIKINENFLSNNEIQIRKILNQKLGFFYHFNNKNNLILYLKNQNTIEISLLINNNKKIFFNYKILNEIFDISIHPSENYSISLTDTKQIVINQINSGEITAIIDLNKIKNIYNFTIDKTGLYIAIICDIEKDFKRNNIIFIEIGTGNLIYVINNSFMMSVCKFYDSKYFFIGGIKGDFTLWLLRDDIQNNIKNVQNQMKNNKNFWNDYEIKYFFKNENFNENFNNFNNDNYYEKEGFQKFLNENNYLNYEKKENVNEEDNINKFIYVKNVNEGNKEKHSTSHVFNMENVNNFNRMKDINKEEILVPPNEILNEINSKNNNENNNFNNNENNNNFNNNNENNNFNNNENNNNFNNNENNENNNKITNNINDNINNNINNIINNNNDNISLNIDYNKEIPPKTNDRYLNIQNFLSDSNNNLDENNNNIPFEFLDPTKKEEKSKSKIINNNFDNNKIKFINLEQNDFNNNKNFNNNNNNFNNDNNNLNDNNINNNKNINNNLNDNNNNFNNNNNNFNNNNNNFNKENHLNLTNKNNLFSYKTSFYSNISNNILNNKPLNNKFNNTFNNKKQFPSYLNHISLTNKNITENNKTSTTKNLLTKSRLNNINNAINDLLQTSESLKNSLQKEKKIENNIKILTNSTEYFINNTKKQTNKNQNIKHPEPSDIDDNLTFPTTTEFKHKNINLLDTHIFTEENTNKNILSSQSNIKTTSNNK